MKCPLSGFNRSITKVFPSTNRTGFFCNKVIMRSNASQYKLSFYLFVCISVSMSSFKFLERHNKVTKREQYIFGSHLDQHFKYQIVVHSNGSIMKCRTAVNLFYLHLIHGKLFPTMICRTRRVVLLHCTALLRSKYQIGKHCTAIQILDG